MSYQLSWIKWNDSNEACSSTNYFFSILHWFCSNWISKCQRFCEGSLRAAISSKYHNMCLSIWRSEPVIRCKATCLTASAAVPVSGLVGWEDTKRFSCLCAWLGPLWSLTIKKDKLEGTQGWVSEKYMTGYGSISEEIFDENFQNSDGRLGVWRVLNFFFKCKALLILLAANTLDMMFKSRHSKRFPVFNLFLWVIWGCHK